MLKHTHKLGLMRIPIVIHLNLLAITCPGRRNRNGSLSGSTLYCLRLKTNVSKFSLNLIKKHFLKENSLGKSFDKHTVKVSYSCPDNIVSIVSSNNKNMRNPNETTDWDSDCSVSSTPNKQR